MSDREWVVIETPNRPDAKVSVWTPDAAPRAVIQIFHGMAEHIERYDRVARELTLKGYAVAGHNHKGHGPETPDDQIGYFYAKGDRATQQDRVLLQLSDQQAASGAG